jgi:hypothetical protein
MGDELPVSRIGLLSATIHWFVLLVMYRRILTAVWYPFCIAGESSGIAMLFVWATMRQF